MKKAVDRPPVSKTEQRAKELKQSTKTLSRILRAKEAERRRARVSKDNI